MEKSKVGSIFIRLCMALAVACIVCLFLVDRGSPEMLITIITLSINVAIVVIYYLRILIRRKKHE